MKPYYQTNLGSLYNCDCLEFMQGMADKSVDLTITSPPYDNLRNYEGYEFNFEEKAVQLFRIIKDGGILVWVVGDSVCEGSESGTSFEEALYFKNKVGFNLHDTMIYRKINPIPLTHNRYEQEFEYMFVLSKGKPITFNPILIKCITSGSYTHRRNTGRVKEASTRNRDEVTVTKDTKQIGNIWSYVCGSSKGETGSHPAPFPMKLSKDHILSWSNEFDTVFDPFIGSGTTAVACEQLGRKWIACEISEKYCEIAARRIEAEYNQIKML